MIPTVEPSAGASEKTTMEMQYIKSDTLIIIFIWPWPLKWILLVYIWSLILILVVRCKRFVFSTDRSRSWRKCGRHCEFQLYFMVVLKSYAICLCFYTSKSQDVHSSKNKTHLSSGYKYQRTGSMIGKDLFEKYSSNAFLSPGRLTWKGKYF